MKLHSLCPCAKHIWNRPWASLRQETFFPGGAGVRSLDYGEAAPASGSPGDGEVGEPQWNCQTPTPQNKCVAPKTNPGTKGCWWLAPRKAELRTSRECASALQQGQWRGRTDCSSERQSAQCNDTELWLGFSCSWSKTTGKLVADEKPRVDVD